ncbi:MAG: alpha/beta fold hydrolase [Granulosicoccus sp.]|nr:alpha/beta fold hydrolase [Granulosicoccus sp.]
MDSKVFSIGNLLLQSGQTLCDARLCYATSGQLNRNADNAVLIPTYYTGTHEKNAAYFGPGRAIDTDRYFVVVPNMFGNGLSSSPSNTTGAQGGSGFPLVSVYDNVQCHYRLLTEVLGVRRVRLATGWSMGAIQVYHFAALYPDMVDALLPFCGSARCSPHNDVFLQGVAAALKADQTFNGGDYQSQPVSGLKAFARVYCGWAYSQTFFRKHQYRELGFDSVEALLRDWEDDHLQWDANDLLAKIATWRSADIASHHTFGGSFERAMKAITARTVVMPCRSDLYFPPEDSAEEVAHMSNAKLKVIDSDWGHCAASPGRNKSTMKVLEDAFAQLLA